MLQQIVEFVVLVVRIHRNLTGANRIEPKLGKEMIGPVLERKRDAMAGAIAFGAEDRGAAGGFCVGLGIGQLQPIGRIGPALAAGDAEEDIVRIGGGGRLKRLPDRRAGGGDAFRICHGRSIKTAMPCPAPRHMERIARLPPVSFRCSTAVIVMRTPVRPGGWPTEMPPP